MFDINNIKLSRLVMPKDDRDYKLSRYITPRMRELAESITQRVWSTTKILDQGQTPHCVGFAWAGFGISQPVEDTTWDNSMGDNIYYAAKVIDGEPGAEDGSNTRSGVQAFMQFGHLKDNAYAFTYSIDDILIWIKTMGPVVVGTNWYLDMFYPDAKGVVHIGGTVAGGHEYMIAGCDDTTQLFLCTNSWGEGFALGGQFYISYADMARLLSQAEGGDSVTTLEITDEPVPTPVPTPSPSPAPDDPCECVDKLLPVLNRIADALDKISKKRFHS